MKLKKRRLIKLRREPLLGGMWASVENSSARAVIVYNIHNLLVDVRRGIYEGLDPDIYYDNR